MSLNLPFKRLTLPLVAVAFLSSCTSLQDDRVSVDYYNISGDTTAALDQDIRRKGPRLNGGRHAVAVARIKMVPNITFTPAGTDRCTITAAKVAVDARVTLPRWVGRAKANKKLGRAWDSIDRYTRAHEAVHVDIAFSFARRIERELLLMPNLGTCEALKLRSRVVIDKLLREHNAAQIAFDEREQRRFRNFAKRQKSNKS
ncbi:MAG: DUF922 domain-containing protein [Pseudomonadota bacterium]